jgi:hypothetical protein
MQLGVPIPIIYQAVPAYVVLVPTIAIPAYPQYFEIAPSPVFHQVDQVPMNTYHTPMSPPSLPEVKFTPEPVFNIEKVPKLVKKQKDPEGEGMIFYRPKIIIQPTVILDFTQNLR